MASCRSSGFLSLAVCVLVCSPSFLFTASAAVPTRVSATRGAPVPALSRGEEKPERTAVPVKQAKNSGKEGMVVPTYPPQMQDEAPKAFMPTVSVVSKKEKEVSSPGRVIVLPEKQKRKSYSEMMVPREAILYKDEDGKTFAVTPEDMYQSDMKPVVVEEEENYYPKTYLKAPVPKTRSPVKVQRKTDKMDIVKGVEPQMKSYVLMQGVEMEEQPAAVMVDTMSPVDVNSFAMPKKQYVKLAQMRDDIETLDNYMKMKIEEKVHAHSDCGGISCFMPQQVCEVPPCKTPSICRDCEAMKKVTTAAAPIDMSMPHEAAEKVWPGFMQRYADRQSMVAYAKNVKDQASRYHMQAPCLYGSDCVARQYEEEAAYSKPSTSTCRVELHPLTSTPVMDCSPMSMSSYSSSPARQAIYSREKGQVGMPASPAPAAPAPGWAMSPPSMSAPVHDAERMPLPMHPSPEKAPMEEWQMPAMPPASSPAIEMPWTKGESSGLKEKQPESFGRRRTYYYYYYPSNGSPQRVVEVRYPTVYSSYFPWRYVVSYQPYSYTVPSPVEVVPSPETVIAPAPAPQASNYYSNRSKQSVGEEFSH